MTMDAKLSSCGKEVESKHWGDDIAERKRNEQDSKAIDSDDEETEREWKQAALSNPPTHTRSASDTPLAEIAEGFRIDRITMGDAATGRMLWEANAWDTETLIASELEAHVPACILECRAVSREVVFSSKHEIKDFQLLQKVYFNNQCIEEWDFRFGFVIPGSTNAWQQTIVGKEQMLRAEDISGRIRIETCFYDGSLLIARNNIRLYYD